ncbi:MAG: hypothetical protein HQM16_16735 [Deltaproteobacteria bacterium]|nr:hypothetical protein [Deltaproteobacteria bacterium]
MPNLRHTKPYTQQFRFIVTREHAGLSLIDFYNRRFSFRSADYWVGLMCSGAITVNQQGVAPDYRLKQDDVIITRRDDVEEPDVADGYQILFEDKGLLVIDKPAPLPVHPAGRYYKNSLIYILREKFPEKKFHTIHRIDTWTTGVLVMATEDETARFLHMQVERQQIKKEYGVLAVGDFGESEFIIDEPVGRIDGAHRGTGPLITDPKESRTIFTPLAKKGAISFLKAEPLTGRTNQIRVHLKARGGHVLNDPLYAPSPQTAIPFMGLHCRRMTFRPAKDTDPVAFEAPWPGHFKKYFNVQAFQS